MSLPRIVKYVCVCWPLKILEIRCHYVCFLFFTFPFFFGREILFEVESLLQSYCIPLLSFERRRFIISYDAMNDASQGFYSFSGGGSWWWRMASWKRIPFKLPIEIDWIEWRVTKGGRWSDDGGRVGCGPEDCTKEIQNFKLIFVKRWFLIGKVRYSDSNCRHLNPPLQRHSYPRRWFSKHTDGGRAEICVGGRSFHTFNWINFCS